VESCVAPRVTGGREAHQAGSQHQHRRHVRRGAVVVLAIMLVIGIVVL
jgi:hypothetical protein